MHFPMTLKEMKAMSQTDLMDLLVFVTTEHTTALSIAEPTREDLAVLLKWGKRWTAVLIELKDRARTAHLARATPSMRNSLDSAVVRS